MRASKWIGGAVLVLLVAAALFFSFGLNTLRGPISRAVTAATGRELLIEGDLRPVWRWLHPRIRAERVSFANAKWGKASHLLTAEAVEATIRVLPLFAGRVVLPEVHLERAGVSLEQDADGRKNWILKEDPEPGKPSRFFIKLLTFDRGVLLWEDAMRDTSLRAEGTTDEGGVNFETEGKWQGLPMKASGHAGHVLSVRDAGTPFSIQGDIKVGDTAAKLKGTIAGLIDLKEIDLRFESISGKSMEELYWIIGLAFPETSPYRVSGRLVRADSVWRFEKFTGTVGESDLAGTLEVRTGGKRPFMHGDVTAKVLNFADLGPLVGTKEPRSGGMLPDMPFDAARWGSVDADVRIRAGTIKRPEQLPLDRLATRIRMRDKVLSLEPLEFGIAGGRLAGTIRLDGNKEPIRGGVNMRVQKLDLAKLLPTVKQAQGSIGNLNGLVELSGAGDSVGKLLGAANGKVGVYIDEGRISRLLMELIALDVWKIALVKLKGDEEVDIRCGIADFAVKDGMMEANALVFDNAVMNISGGGKINLRNETMDLTLKPQPKDRSIAPPGPPLRIRGTFGAPEAGLDMGVLAARGGGAIAIGILNPLLGVLPLIEEGKGSNCGQLIAQATSSGRSAASGATAPRPPSRPAR